MHKLYFGEQTNGRTHIPFCNDEGIIDGEHYTRRCGDCTGDVECWRPTVTIMGVAEAKQYRALVEASMDRFLPGLPVFGDITDDGISVYAKSEAVAGIYQHQLSDWLCLLDDALRNNRELMAKAGLTEPVVRGKTFVQRGCSCYVDAVPVQAEPDADGDPEEEPVLAEEGEGVLDPTDS